MPNEILVTGANGFIGKKLIQTLSAYGHIVRRCSRNLSEDSDVAVGEIGPDTDWSTAVEGISTVIHLAGRAHILDDILKDPLKEFRKVNVEGTLMLARHSASAGVKRLVYISSIGVNGIQSSRPFLASDIPNPSGPYAISKYEAEQGLCQIAESTDMEVVIIRPPLVYGYDAPGNFGYLMRVINRGIPLPLGTIYNKRSFIALDNLVDFIITCARHPAAANEIFTISDDEDLSTTELLIRIASALNKRTWLFPVNQKLLEFGLQFIGKKKLAQSLLGSLEVDISKAKKILNWTPPVSVDEGLRKTAQHFLESNS